MKFTRYSQISRPALLATLACLLAPPGFAQTPQPIATAGSDAGVNASLADLQSEVHELKQMILQLQQQTTASRAEISHLREELEAQRASSGAATGAESALDEPSPAASSSTTVQLEHRVEQLAEDQQLLSGKIDDQYQTKVESASKYRVRFSGIVLFNLFSNSGSVDNLDVPAWAREPSPGDSSGAVGGTMRQSILGFEVFGPTLM